MAMNKTEQAEMQRLIEAATPMFPSYAQPKPLTNDEIKDLPTVEVTYKYDPKKKVSVTPVWFINVSIAMDRNSSNAATLGCMTDFGTNRHQVADTTSRRDNSEIVFATELDAMQYVRHEVAKAFATRLAKIDGEIKKLMA